jgi:hypothetical protein
MPNKRPQVTNYPKYEIHSGDAVVISPGKYEKASYDGDKTFGWSCSGIMMDVLEPLDGIALFYIFLGAYTWNILIHVTNEPDSDSSIV